MKIRGWYLMIVAVAVVMISLGCEPTATVVTQGGPTISQAMSQPVHGPKMRIAVMQFDNRSRYAVGDGMRSMLTTTLFHTNRFILVEREQLPDVLTEQKLGTTGVIRKDTAAPVGNIEGAQLLIYGTVTTFEPGQRGIKSVMGGAQQSFVSIELKIVDAATSRVVSATTVDGRGTDVALDTSALRYVGMSPLYSLSVWSNTPVETAIRACIARGVDYIVSNI
jgi:curli biogenesis system outer membrane secretion channel CsgG